MSTKRFTMKGSMILENGEEITAWDCCELLNGQQSTITALKKENEQLRKELDNFKPIIFKNMQKGTIILYSKGDVDE